MDFNEGDNAEMEGGLDDLIGRMKELLLQMPREMKVLEEPIMPKYTESYMQNLQAYRKQKQEAEEDAPAFQMPDIDDLTVIQDEHPDKLKQLL